MDMQIKFRIILDPEKETWLQKLERWAESQKPPVSFLLSVLVAWLKEYIIEYKVQREMPSIEAQAEKMKEEWAKDDPKPIYTTEPSEVKGLDIISILGPWERE